MCNEQQEIQKTFQLMGRNLNIIHKCLTAIYSKNVHGPTYKEPH